MASSYPNFVPHKSCYWFPYGIAACPFISSVISQTPGELVFDGYFHTTDESTPFERIVYSKTQFSEGYYHIRITSKQTLEDTSASKQSDDAEEPNFVPNGIATNKIRLTYEVLASNISYEKALEAINQIQNFGFCDHACGGRGGDGNVCEKAFMTI